jgi:hypothetical protein
LLHWCVAGVLLPEVPRRPAPEAIPAISAISAQLAVTEAAVEPPAPMLRSLKSSAPQQRGQPEVAVPPRTTPELAYYPATELDAFPRLLAPLELHRLENAAEGGRIRAVVKIDELGLVRDVEIAGTDRREGLRVVLAAARFAPALKDGQPVRSRVVLDVNFAGY